jgi:hypothetical protein
LNTFVVPVMCLLLAFSAAAAARAVDPAFLAMTDCPKQPGCPAIIFVDEIELNNESSRSHYSFHRVIKLFTQEGVERYADVETSAQVGGYTVRNLEGRTILPDRTSIPLKEENIFVKTLHRGKRWEKVKSAKFPGVVPGAIIEYSYDVLTEPNSILTEVTWFIQQRVPVLSSKFTLKPGSYKLGWKQAGLEKVVVSTESPFKNVTYLRAADVPAIPDEPFAPPDDALRARLYFDLPELQAAWLGFVAGSLAGESGKFIEGGPAVADKIKELVQPADPPLEKVRKIYRFVQEKIGSEEARAGQTGESAVKEAESVGDVLTRAYGSEWERTLLFLALVKQTGLEHALLLITGRNNTIFNPEVPDEDQLDSFAAAVKTGGGWTFYDPAARHCPFGMISAEKEGGVVNTVMIVPTKGAGAPKRGQIQYLTVSRPETFYYTAAAIPFSTAGKNILKREAAVKLTEDGTAEVTASQDGSGLVDLDHRERYELLDEQKRKAALLEDLQRLLPRAELASASFENITAFDKTATLYYELKLPGFATVVGDRIAVTPSLFGAFQRNPFTAESRRTAVHFAHTRRTQDRISIEIPAGYEVEELPAPVVVRDPPFSLAMSYSREGRNLILARRVEIDAATFPAGDYPRLRAFFEKLQEADKRAVVFRKGSPS